MRSCNRNPTSPTNQGLNHRSAALSSTGNGLVRFPALLLAQSLPRKRFLCPALLAGLHVEAMLLDFLDDVFLLHLALETTQGVLQRFTFLDNDFGHSSFTPNPVRIGNLRRLIRVATPPRVIIARGIRKGHAGHSPLRDQSVRRARADTMPRQRRMNALHHGPCLESP